MIIAQTESMISFFIRYRAMRPTHFTKNYFTLSTYRNNKEDPGVLIDHAFTNSDNVYMEFIPAIEQGFNHHGMFITIK